jgi:hypothetical protein
MFVKKYEIIGGLKIWYIFKKEHDRKFMCKNTLSYFGLFFLKRQVKRNGGSITNICYFIKSDYFLKKTITNGYNMSLNSYKKKYVS